MTARPLRIGLALALAIGIAAEMACLAGVTGALSIDYFDAWEYLGNARVLAEGEEAAGIAYRWRRPPLLPLLQAALWPGSGGLEGVLEALARSHWLAWGLSLATLLALGLHLRRSHGALGAAFGTALVAANPMFLHLVPFGLVDVPAMLFTLLALDGVLRALRGGRGARWQWSLALAAAMLAKYNLGLLPLAILLFAGLSARGAGAAWRPLASRLWLPLAGAGLVWLGVQLGLQARLGELSPTSLLALPRMLLGEAGVVSAVVWDDPRSEYLQEIFQTTPWIGLAAAALGLGLAVRAGDDADRLHALWLVLFVGAMSLFVGSKSSRYLLPALPSLVHLQLRGLRAAAGWLRARLAPRRPELARSWRGEALLALAVALLWAPLPLRQALHQLRHFEEPVYRSDFVAEVARTLERETPPETPIFWRGAYYAIVPEERVFFPHDETFWFYHLGPSSLETLLGRRVGRWPAGVATDPRSLADRLRSDCVRVDSSAVLHLGHRAERMPDPPEPLEITWIERRTLTPPWPEPPLQDGWQRFVRPEPERPAEPLAPGAAPAAGAHALELVRLERRAFRFP